jgi:hypothetical protein
MIDLRFALRQPGSVDTIRSASPARRSFSPASPCSAAFSPAVGLQG